MHEPGRSPARLLTGPLEPLPTRDKFQLADEPGADLSPGELPQPPAPAASRGPGYETASSPEVIRRH